MRPVEPIDSSPHSTVPGAASAATAPVQPGRELTRFPVLDGLRGFAAVGIAIIHYLFGPSRKLPGLAHVMRLLEMTPLSLDIFFILSGFLIGGILLRSRNSPDYYRTFYRRRFFRILPVYYVWIALFGFLYFFAQGWGLMPPAGFSGAFYLFSFVCFFQNFIPAIIESTFIVAPTWTLVVEEHFYLLAPICVRRMSSRRLVQSLVTVILLAPLFRGVLFKFIGHRAAWADIATRIWPPCRADAVALGVLLAILWHSPELRQWLHNHLPLFVCGMFAGSAVAMVLEYMARANFAYCRFLHASIGRSAVELASFCLIVYLICRPLSVFARFFSTNLMRELGKISYCLYVIHWGILWMIFRFVLHTRFGERLWLDFTVAPVALLLSIAIARLSWKYFEYPLLQRAHGAPRQISVRPIPERQPQIA